MRPLDPLLVILGCYAILSFRGVDKRRFSLRAQMPVRRAATPAQSLIPRDV